MEVIDFQRSFVTFFGHDDGNIARILLDAACTMTDERSGESGTYYLIAPCRSERMYRDDVRLFQLPNYEFCGIFAADDCLLVRTHQRSERDNREYGRNTERFAGVKLDVRRLIARELADAAQILDATLGNLPLVARTALRDEATGRAAVLEYPIKTMNVLREGPRFQVDTGPLLVPDFASSSPRAIERFDLAHVVYHRHDTAEFILRRPQVVGGAGGVPVTDYSAILTFPARNTILGID